VLAAEPAGGRWLWYLDVGADIRDYLLFLAFMSSLLLNMQFLSLMRAIIILATVVVLHGVTGGTLGMVLWLLFELPPTLRAVALRWLMRLYRA